MTGPVGVLHPGAMGVTIGASIARAAGVEVMWASDGRSAATAERATRAGFTDARSLRELVDASSTIVSVCPPGDALAVARSVAELGFSGTYVEANAVSPTTTRAVADLFDDVVDGGIIGPPVEAAGTTRLYLSGPSSAAVTTLFDGSDLEVRIVDGDVGAASAVKMCFGAWTKASSSFLLAINAVAEHEGVADDLRAEWATSMPDVIERSRRSPANVGPKAWRFEAEMHEIGDTFAAAGLHDGFLRAAADTYHRLAGLRHATETDQPTSTPTLDDVVELLRARPI